MVDFFLVETKLISSSQPVSNFSQSKIDKLAKLILDANGLLRPLVLKETGFEKYEVVSGHLEYYAAIRAKEKNPQKAEMVNALVIESEEEKSARQQAQLLEQLSSAIEPDSTTSITPLDNLASNLEDLFNRELKAMSQKLETNLKQISDQLPKQTKPIDAFNQLRDVDLTRRLISVGVKGKNLEKIVEQIVKKRPFNSLSEVVKQVNGLSEKKMVEIVDSWADLLFT